VSQLAADGVDLLVVLNGSPFEEGKGHLRTELVARRAREVRARVGRASRPLDDRTGVGLEVADARVDLRQGDA